MTDFEWTRPTFDTTESTHRFIRHVLVGKAWFQKRLLYRKEKIKTKLKRADNEPYTHIHFQANITTFFHENAKTRA